MSVAAFVICAFIIVQESNAEDFAQTGRQRMQWPQITELRVKVHFDVKKQRAFKQVICDASGAPLYIVDARMPSDDERDPDYDYSGAFDCRLCPVNPNNWGEGYPSLLQNVRNATRDWETDGRFLNSELMALAGSNGSRFLVQRSRLRGMSVIIEINNVLNGENKKRIESFDACFLFQNDRLAVSDIAAPPVGSQNKK